MRSGVLFSLLSLGVGLAAGPSEATAADEPALAGYSVPAARAERDWEARFRALPSADSLREYNRRLSAHPHPAGSEAGKHNAEWILSRLREWGLEAQTETFYALLPTPRERVVELLQPRQFTCRLQEPTVAADSASFRQSEQLPTFNAYSSDGDVTAPLVYVNRGLPEDYVELERIGISVRGAIVIARYGGAFRGVKPKLAFEHGAVGCLIYSDPREDGYFSGEVFPEGPFRPLEGVQRGSVMDQSIQPGDPLTPGTGATFGAKRLALKDALGLTRIPVLPLSSADAQPLLAELRGPVAPEGWRGALPITYHVGPGPASVHLKVSSNWELRPLYDVIARIPGGEAEDEWVIRGNHHDAWVNGSQDPVSGMASLLEEARAMGQLLKAGWKPRRTIFLCAWDGEEPGLLGSTEWVEEHAEALRQHAVLYINSDSNGRGFLEAAGSHTLEEFMNGVARDVQDPETRLSAGERLRLRAIGQARTAGDRRELRGRATWRLGALGSGSDYTAFLDHLGVASLNLGYGGEDVGGVYHSIYDDFYWYTHFADTDFRYGCALAQTAGMAVMRMADAELLPLDFTGLADHLGRFVDEAQAALDKERDESRELNLKLEEGYFAALADPKKPTPVPTPRVMPPELDFKPLRAAVDSLRAQAARYDAARARACAGTGEALRRVGLSEINQRLMGGEHRLTHPAGLPGRPWYRHLVYAPGRYTGYGVKPLPGVREAIEQGRWAEARQEIGRVAQALNSEAALIGEVVRELQSQ